MHNSGCADDQGPSAAHVWLVLSKAKSAIQQNAVHSIAGLGLGLTDFAVLETLLHKGPQPVSVIGKRVLLTSGSITSAIDRLEAKDFVRRTTAGTDRRSRIVELTSAGRRTIEAAFAQHANDMAETLAILRPAERKELVRLLKKAGLWAQSRLDDIEARRSQKSRVTNN